MKITHLPKEVSISICGKHYFGCDYIFANIYGSSVFSEEESKALPQDESLGEISRDPESGDFSKETLEEFISSDTGDILDLSTLPDVNKEIEYSTLGTLQSDGKGGYLIRYSGDFTPICIHAQDEKITLNGQEDDFSELVFEKDKRNYICLPESLFLEDTTEENENQSPIMLCLTAECVENNLKEDGGVLHVSYSIEVNGITAEVTDFTLTVASGEEVSPL
ncbi:MAG: DUF1934 family protein [Clostridia bacterium]|nr:DUF1934 family protein [Clostridia bacterium]